MTTKALTGACAALLLGVFMLLVDHQPALAQCGPTGSINCAVGYTDAQESKTAAYALNSSDCGYRILASGGTFWTLTAGTVPTGCQVWLTNVDPLPGAGATGAKFVSFVNCQDSANAGTYVWPGGIGNPASTIEMVYTASGWVATKCPAAFVLPAGAGFILNWDPVNGSDTWGVADGLATGARALGSANNAGYFANINFAANAQAQFTIKCTVAAGSCSGHTETAQIHWPFYGGIVSGAQGRSAVTLNCNGATLGATYPAVSLFFAGTNVAPVNCANINGLSVSENAMFEDSGAGGNSYCAPSTGAVFTVQFGGFIWLTNNTSICSGTVAYLVQNSHGQFANSATMTFTGSLTVTGQVIFSQQIGMTTMGIVSGGSNVTGQKWDLQGSSFLDTTGNSVPGTVAGAACATCGTD